MKEICENPNKKVVPNRHRPRQEMEGFLHHMSGESLGMAIVIWNPNQYKDKYIENDIKPYKHHIEPSKHHIKTNKST